MYDGLTLVNDNLIEIVDSKNNDISSELSKEKILIFESFMFYFQQHVVFELNGSSNLLPFNKDGNMIPFENTEITEIQMLNLLEIFQ